MKEELRNYLTPVELKQLDSLIEKAEERRKQDKEKEEADASGQCLLLLKCQCERGKGMTDEESMKMEIDLKEDLEKILQKICQFCKSQGFFGCCRDEHTSGDEELPFEL